MEKVLSQEDRIRRAEEIYYRRNNAKSGRTATVNLNPKKEYKLLKRIIIQILICVGIYFGIYWMKENTDSFSIDSISYIKNTLCYDVDFEKWINNAKNYIVLLLPKEEQKNEIIEEASSIQEEILSEEDKNDNVEIKTEPEEVQDTSNLSKMEQDALYIKTNFSLIKPVTGTITSRFGPRNPTTPTVPKYHTGIDIAVNEGTIFVASMDGIVEQVSSEGDYRKSYKNNK